MCICCFIFRGFWIFIVASDLHLRQVVRKQKLNGPHEKIMIVAGTNLTKQNKNLASNPGDPGLSPHDRLSCPLSYKVLQNQRLRKLMTDSRLGATRRFELLATRATRPERRRRPAQESHSASSHPRSRRSSQGRRGSPRCGAPPRCRGGRRCHDCFAALF
jgi:hypothetical protein